MDSPPPPHRAFFESHFRRTDGAVALVGPSSVVCLPPGSSWGADLAPAPGAAGVVPRHLAAAVAAAPAGAPLRAWALTLARRGSRLRVHLFGVAPAGLPAAALAESVAEFLAEAGVAGAVGVGAGVGAAAAADG